MSKVPRWVQEKIDDIRKNNLTELDLRIEKANSDSKLETLIQIPEEIFELTNLTKLNLMNHEIKEIPAKLSNLTRLRFLAISGPFTLIPNKLRSLQFLESLTLAGEYQLIPKWIGNLPRLNALALFGIEGTMKISSNSFLGNIGNFTEIPRSILNLHNLQFLSLSFNIDTFPLWLSNLNKLENFSINGLYEIPDEIDSFHHLTSLHLGGNYTIIPESLFSLSNLRVLSLIGNYAEIPSNILNLENLIDLDTFCPNIEMPPPEIVQQGLVAICDYYLSLKNAEDHLFESKLLILGEGGAGKTTLAKKIIKPEYNLDEKEESTEGIDVLR